MTITLHNALVQILFGETQQELIHVGEQITQHQLFLHFYLLDALLTLMRVVLLEHHFAHVGIITLQIKMETAYVKTQVQEAQEIQQDHNAGLLEPHCL